MADFYLANLGSILTLTPTSDRARGRVADNIPEDSLVWGACSIAIEPRYIGPIVDGITADGLSIG